MSKIEVDQITQQSGTTITVGGGACKTAVVDATTVTLGRCGGSVALASGASQTGFGRTGTVDWQTSIKTSTFTAANGEGYFVNTTGGAVTVNLPAGSAGAIVSIKDYAQTFDTNNCTISADGSEKIENLTQDLVLDTEGIAVTLIYADATRGWQAVNSNEVTNVVKFITATGGTITTSGDFKIHTFTGPGTFCVSCGGNAGGSNTVDYLVVAGGGGGGGNRSLGNANGGGGGGAGGYRESGGTASGCYTVSPLGSSPSPVAALPVSVQGYPITVGGGGAQQSSGAPVLGNPGNNSVFSTITSAAGGGGAGSNCSGGQPGGSGGGGGPTEAGTGTGGTGNTPPVSPPQGNDGQTIGSSTSGYGGSALGSGPSPGATSSINGTPTARAGGGAGGNSNTGSPGGGGNSGGTNASGTAGTANTGGGGGGAGGGSGGACGGAGGSGVVIIRYKYQS